MKPFLELKALWNATERCCAWYMMGADGLKEKINRAIEGKKVGYTEMLSPLRRHVQQGDTRRRKGAREVPEGAGRHRGQGERA